MVALAAHLCSFMGTIRFVCGYKLRPGGGGLRTELPRQGVLYNKWCNVREKRSI